MPGSLSSVSLYHTYERQLLHENNASIEAIDNFEIID